MTNYELMEAIGRVDEEFLLPCLEERKAISMKRSVKIAILAAALLILLATAAVALSGPDGFLSRLFGESYDIIGDYVMMEPISAENDKARLTVESALTDGYHTYLVFSIERLDGGTLDGFWPDIEIDQRMEWFVDAGATWGKFETGNETPQKCWYLWQGRLSSKLESIDLWLFSAYNSDTGETVDFGELMLNVAPVSCPVKLGGPGGEPMGRDVFAAIVLSPIGFRIEAWPNTVPVAKDGSGQWNRETSGVTCEVVMVYKDGSEVDISEQVSRSLTNSYDNLWTIFEKPLDIELIEGVRLNGEYFALEYGEPAPARNGSGWLLESSREYVYGEHEPVYPILRAESDTAALDVESIWTDGKVVEIFFYADFADGKYRELHPILGGIMDIRAVDKDGATLGVAYQYYTHLSIKDDDGGLRFLHTGIFYIGGEAETLTLEVEGAELEIPLDMRKLKRLPKGEPYTEPTPEPTPPPDMTELYTAEYDSLFRGIHPDEVNISADNGDYRLTIEYLYHRNSGKEGMIKTMMLCERLDGSEYKDPRRQRAWELYAVRDGSIEKYFSGNLGSHSWYEGNMRHVVADWDYKFRKEDIDTIRVVWTPPSGERIEIDIPVE